MRTKSNKIQALLQLLLFGGILVVLNIFANYFYTSLDLTEDKRFTLTSATKEMLNDIEDPVYIRVLLTGKFSKGFKRLQRSTREMLDDFKSQSGYIEYVFENPYDGTSEEIQTRQQEWAKDGIVPTRLTDLELAETSEQYIYPWILINYKGRFRKVSILENQVTGLNPEVAINNSISLLEYKIADAIQKIKAERPPTIAFLTGHGELTELETKSFENELRSFARTGRLVLDSLTQIDERVDLVIVPKPTQPFSEKDKFKLDQYLMNGGKIMWLVDRMDIAIDSLAGKPFYIPTDYPLNIEDQLFKYGVKIEPNLVLDIESSRIPQVVGEVNGKAQIEMFPWYYHPLVTSKSDHPIVKNLDRVNLIFPSSIDTAVFSPTPLQKTVLLESSKYTRTQYSPVRVSQQILAYKPDPSKFNKPPQVMGVLVEGIFTSLYKNRVDAEMAQGLARIQQTFKEQSVPTAILVVSDGDIIKNELRKDGTPEPTGFSRLSQYTFANGMFLKNAVDFLLDNQGVIDARSREVKLRLLDTVKAKKEKTYWQLLNIGLPLALLLLFGLGYQLYRKRKYSN